MLTKIYMQIKMDNKFNKVQGIHYNVRSYKITLMIMLFVNQQALLLDTL